MKWHPFERIEPVSFAFVMATAVISIAFNLTGWPLMSLLFLLMGSIGYGVLVLIFSLRFLFYRQQVKREFADVLSMFKYLTFCAGTNSLAVAFCLTQIAHLDLVCWILGIIGPISTVILTYVIFFHLFFRSRLSLLAISPYWLLLAIASNSSGIVITTFWQQGSLTHPLFMLIAYGYWAFGVAIYFIFMTLNTYRFFFFEFSGKDLYPAYWTCMGAAAIAVVDGCNLAFTANVPAFKEAAKPFIDGMNLTLWVWGTFWIPILCMMEISKYFYFKIPFRYHPSLWAFIFPLGMYTVATYKLSTSENLEYLSVMVPYCLWIAAAFWSLVALSGIFQAGKTPLENK